MYKCPILSFNDYAARPFAELLFYNYSTCKWLLQCKVSASVWKRSVKNHSKVACRIWSKQWLSGWYKIHLFRLNSCTIKYVRFDGLSYRVEIESGRLLKPFSGLWSVVNAFYINQAFVHGLRPVSVKHDVVCNECEYSNHVHHTGHRFIPVTCLPREPRFHVEILLDNALAILTQKLRRCIRGMSSSPSLREKRFLPMGVHLIVSITMPR